MRVIRGCESHKRWSCGGVENRSAMANEEETPMLQNEEQFYTGEKAPESKHAEEKTEVKTEVKASEAVCGYPVGPDGVVVGEPVPMPRQPWSTPVLGCLGNNDEFCLSDMQVCMMGSCAPCVLYASNMELLNPGHDSFISHCMAYTSLYAMGQFLFGASIAPCFSFPSRIALRQVHNLEGHGENFVKAVGCCSGSIQSELEREHWDSFCDFALHICCHRCALCQEGREIRRRTAHTGQRPHYYTMAAPSQQTME